MAMNGDVLGAALMVAINEAITAHPTAGPAQRAAIWSKIGNAIVTHIQLLATVNVTVASVGGVTVGAGISGSGTGSGSIS